MSSVKSLSPKPRYYIEEEWDHINSIGRTIQVRFCISLMNLDEPDITIQVAVPGEWKTLKPGGEVFVDVSESIDHNDIIADIGKFLAGEALSECTLIYEENFASVPPHWWEGRAARSCC